MNVQGSHGPNVRYQMQPTTAGHSTSVSRGSNFSKRLGGPNQDGTQSHRTDEAKPKIKKRKAHPKFDQQRDMEIEARMLEQQRQAARDAKPARTSPPTSTSTGI